jgi:hypothetical protein
MTIKISIIGNESTSEYKDALLLKDLFEHQLSNKLNGDILIISNATLFCYRIKDIVLIAIGILNVTKTQL